MGSDELWQPMQKAGLVAGLSTESKTEEIEGDPKVRAALAKVPGMKALRLDTLSRRDIVLGSIGAIDQARMVKDGESSVVELTRSAIRRAQAGEHLGFIDRPLFDEAIAQAKRMDEELKDMSVEDREALFAAKPLYGVPTTFKANLAYEGIPGKFTLHA